jgi:hypothetical protein
MPLPRTVEIDSENLSNHFLLIITLFSMPILFRIFSIACLAKGLGKFPFLADAIQRERTSASLWLSEHLLVANPPSGSAEVVNKCCRQHFCSHFP